MEWILIGEKKGRYMLSSKSSVTGLLPKGSFLTIEERDTKFILRVDDSFQNETFSPSPYIAELDLAPLEQDQQCSNIVLAYRVKTVSKRSDGLIDFIKPQLKARRSNQEEIDLALGDIRKGSKVFIGTVHSGENQVLIDNSHKKVTARLPEDMFFHQLLVCGRTGSGKTVSMKYLAQYFCEKMNGAVLAINVKEQDFLRMDQESKVNKKSFEDEWNILGEKPHGVSSYKIYYPATVTNFENKKNISLNKSQKITLKMNDLDPESLVGLLQGISDAGAQNLPSIFRFWREKKASKTSTFIDFIEYFKSTSSDRTFDTMNIREDISQIQLHAATYSSILRKLDKAAVFFDNSNSHMLDEEDILQPGKMSIIDIANQNGRDFGAIVLRNLLNKIVAAKSDERYDVPVLIIIDEVHMFYGDSASSETLGSLDTICRTGRSMKIGVMFASQNPSDVPKGIETVVNSKIFFKSDQQIASKYGITLSKEEITNLDPGFAGVSIHGLPQVKIIKFPISYSGVFIGEKNE